MSCDVYRNATLGGVNYMQDDVLSSIFFSMIPSFRIVILMDIVMMLGVPLSLIFHKQ